MPNWTDQIDHLRLVRSEGIGPVTYRRLLERYRSASAALDALPRLARAGGKGGAPTTVSRAAAEAELERTHRLGGRMVFLGDADYPEPLAHLADAPPCLIIKGDLSLTARTCIALVGGRNASGNGQRMAEQLAVELAAASVVVSGLARGIDTAAHQGAMRAGRTIAVIAGGLDQPYPPENARLHQQIGEQHLLVTEAPVGTVPQARHFPPRNRIIAGLSSGVVVIEAALRSGSLITARMAQDAGREVFAVPGSPLDPRARGGNDLIRQGAVLVETAADVLNNLPTEPTCRTATHRDHAFPQPGETDAPARHGRRNGGAVASGYGQEDGRWGDHADSQGDSQWDGPWSAAGDITDAAAGAGPTTDAMLALLSTEPIAVDDLVRRCQLSPPVLMAVLLELELAARVETLPGNRVALLPPANR